MFGNKAPLERIPQDIRAAYGTSLKRATPNATGVVRLVHIRKTQHGTWEDQRVRAHVITPDGFSIPSVNVAFFFSTAPAIKWEDLYPGHYFSWDVPQPEKALVFPTMGSGEIDVVQGSTIDEGETGGMTVCVLEPDWPCDIVSGCGMLADHSGLHLTFMVIPAGYKSINERLTSIEARLTKLEGG